MDKALALLMTTMLLLAGCLGTDDTEEDDVNQEENNQNEIIDVIGCDNLTSLTYDANVTVSNESSCLYADVLLSELDRMAVMIGNGLDEDFSWEDNPDAVFSHSMELYENNNYFFESAYISADKYFASEESSEFNENGTLDQAFYYMIMQGNEIEYSISNSTHDYTIRMKHTDDYMTALESMFSEDDDLDMGDDSWEDGDYNTEIDWEPYYGGYCEWEGNPDDDSDVWSCKEDESDSDWDTWWYYCELHDGDWFCTDDYGQSPDYENSADYDCYLTGNEDDESSMGRQTGMNDDYDDDYYNDDEDEDSESPTASDYTVLITDNEPSLDGNYSEVNLPQIMESGEGYMFSGEVDSEGEVLVMELYTNLEYSVVGVKLTDTQNDRYVMFSTIVEAPDIDQTLPYTAMPFILIDTSDFDDDSGDNGDDDYHSDIDWEPYYGGYCEWEGNPDDDSDVWSCKDDESDSDWGTWWYYCELHDGDWFCTDDYGQSSDYENSADNDCYLTGDCSDENDSEMSLDDFDVSSWDSANDLQQIVDWFNMNYDYDEDEDMFTVDDFLSFCDADADYVDYYVAECVLGTALSMLYYDEEVSEEMVCYNPNTHVATMDDEDSCSSYVYIENYTIDEGEDICYNIITHEVTGDDNSSCISYGFYNVTSPSGSGQQCYNNASHSFNDDDENTCTQYAYYENQSWGGTTFTGCYNMGTHTTNSDSKEVCESYAWHNSTVVVDEYCYNTVTHLVNWNSSMAECAGYMYVEDYGATVYTGCYNTMTHMTTDDNQEDCTAYTYVSMDEEPSEEIHYYDNCTDDNGTYECWMDEWDYDNDGEFDESHGFDYSDCTQQSNGSWMCITGHGDDYDDSEDGSGYYCVPFVNYTSEGFSIFNSTNLDSSLCGEPIEEDMVYEFDSNETWTMPAHLIWQDCEDDGTDCETGEIMYDVSTTELWETTHENNYMDCDGAYDNNTSMCTEWIGNVTASDGSAFVISHSEQDLLVFYQYEESTQSGLVIFVQSDSQNDDMDYEEMFDMLDLNGDGEVNSSEWYDSSNSSDDSMSEEDYDNLLIMIDVFDDDNSGGLNIDEFVNFMENADSMNEDGEMNVDMMFDMFDANDDGQVTASEWSDFFNGTDDESFESYEDIENLVDMLDEDESGGLDIDEFSAFFESVDENEGEDAGERFTALAVYGVMPMGGDLDDYELHLTTCEDADTFADVSCEEPAYTAKLSDILMTDEMMILTTDVLFVDTDESGTLTIGDAIMIDSSSLEEDGIFWEDARLYSQEAEAYTDENPMLPGFTIVVATIAMLGAALIRRD